jgi:formate/nitrite transporter FocA (FNT family)
MNALRNFDLFLVIVTAPVLALIGAPVLGTLVGAGAWLLQRGAAYGLARHARRQENVRSAVALTFASSMARSWLVALAVLAVGIAGAREDGLTAAILVLVAYTVYFASAFAVRTLERSTTAS